VGEIAEAAAGAQGFMMLAPVLGQMITGLFTGNFAQIIRAVPMTILDNSAAQAGVSVILNAVAQPVQNFVQYTIRQGQMFYNVTIQRRRQQAEQLAQAQLAAAQAANTQSTAAPQTTARTATNTVQMHVVPGRVLINSPQRSRNGSTLIRQEGDVEEEGGNNNFEEVGEAVGNILTHVLSGNLGHAVGSVNGLVQDADSSQGVASILNPLVNPIQSIVKFTINQGQQYLNVTMQGTQQPSNSSTTNKAPTDEKLTPQPIVITVDEWKNSPPPPPVSVSIPETTTAQSSGEDNEEDYEESNKSSNSKLPSPKKVVLKRRLFYSM